MDLIARTLVRGAVAGIHPSPFRGTGGDFARHRPYQQGDPVRSLDWKLFARTDRLYVREYREESNLRAFLVMDSSLSMGFAGLDGNGLSKLRYAVYAAAALAHLMLAAGDAVGLASYGAEPRLLLPPRSRRGYLHELLLALERLEVGGEGSAAAALDRIGDALPRRGRVLLFSDLLEPDGGDALMQAAGRLRARGDEVIVLRVLSAIEAGEEVTEPALFFDPEHPGRRVAAAPAADPGYRGRIAAYYKVLEESFREHGIEYLPLLTREPVEHALVHWLQHRDP